MDEIMNYIHCATTDFYIKYGCRPSFLYVGKYEIDCIKLYIEKNATNRTAYGATGKDRLAGLDLIVVDSETHINIAGSTQWNKSHPTGIMKS